MFPIYLALLIGLATGRALRQRYLLDPDVLRELDEWELKQLRDFVRGKGRGSVSRFPAEFLEKMDERDDGLMLDLTNPMVMDQGGINMLNSAPPAPQGYVKIITPTNIIAPPEVLEKMKQDKPPKRNVQTHFPRTKQPPKGAEKRAKRPPPKVAQEEPNKQTFKEMADLLKGFLNRRQEMLKQESHANAGAGGQWETITDSPKLEERVLRPPHAFSTQAPATTTADLDDMSKEEYEAKLQSLSKQLSEIMSLIQKTKEGRRPMHQKLPPRPRLTIIRNGTAEQTKDGQYDFVSTISLIQDGDKNILVDTGMGTDINGRTHLLSKMSSLGLAPPNIHIVVSTHGHPDHNGGVHDFPDSIHYQGWYQHFQSRFNLSGLFEGERHQLTDNVYLLRSPGHSSDDLAVIVKDEANLGSVAIAGDTFLRKEDIDYQMMWKPLSANENQQAESRRRLACGQWRWIVPGHGPPFPLEAAIRSKFGC